MSLRSRSKCPIFVSGKELPKNALPTYEDVIRYFLFLTKNTSSQRDLVKNTSEIIATEIASIWRKASIPTSGHRAIVIRLHSYHNKYRSILKPYHGRKEDENYIRKLEEFKKNSKKLFDIASCKCLSFAICSCEIGRKVPIEERDFLTDQRTERNMIIGGIDSKTSKQINKKIMRRTIRKLRETPQLKNAAPINKETPVLSNSSNKTISREIQKISAESATLTKPPIPASPSFSVLPELPYVAVARTLDRFGISDRAGAAIVSATLQDIGMITKESAINVVDRSKIRRVRAKTRSTAIETQFTSCQEYICISFDGRKDKTLVLEDNRRRVINEEHITVLQEPGSRYLGHISLKSGNASAIADSLFEFFVQKSITLTQIVAIGCDGTVVNTGVKAGVIRNIESKLKRPLQWLVCQLHANELSLRHLFQHLDGTTTGPKSFSGPIGKTLSNCEDLPIKNFSAIACDLPDITINRGDLSTDQLYLLEMCQAVSKGQCDDKLAKRKPGKICHSRWLTTANSILRLYIATDSPSDNLKILAEFVLKVYAPMWFNIKTQPHCIYGAKHLLNTIKLSRYLPKSLKKVIDPVIQRNGYFGHCENILIGMLADDRVHIKELALRKIIQIRKSFTELTPIRQFKLQPLNFNADEIIDLVNWENPTEPPLTRMIPTDVISEALVDFNMVDTIILPAMKEIPCHTQATERAIKIVTESCLAVCGPVRREGWIKNKQESCRIMPKFHTKKQYKIQ